MVTELIYFALAIWYAKYIKKKGGLFMKKFSILILTFILIWVLAGCNSASSTPSTPTVAENGYKLFDMDFSPWATEEFGKDNIYYAAFLDKGSRTTWSTVKEKTDYALECFGKMEIGEKADIRDTYTNNNAHFVTLTHFERDEMGSTAGYIEQYRIFISEDYKYVSLGGHRDEVGLYELKNGKEIEKYFKDTD